MRLTTYTDYSLRTLMYLAVAPGGLASISEVAKAYGISRNHLMKVVHQLGRAGDVETARGRRGGFRLARPPAELNLGVLVRRLEPDLEIAACFGHSNSCVVAPACLLQGALNRALQAFLSVLDGYTIADLVVPHGPLAALLGIDATRYPAAPTVP
ncbi:MAG: transcriptional regulator, BadM/Rrf2 family [Rhodospirillales bacterium]|nr:transcriptional regulator, BadM/Rrf2 family [Rhodospirillales bacterium]